MPLNKTTKTDKQILTDEVVLPVIEEQLNVEKRKQETAEVTLTKTIHEEQQVIDTSILEENVEVERVPVNKYIDELPESVRQEGDTTIVSVVKEVIVKKLLLVEEVHLKKVKHHKAHETPITLRKEVVDVKRSDHIDAK
jgi:stress response protein YsnF